MTDKQTYISEAAHELSEAHERQLRHNVKIKIQTIANLRLQLENTQALIAEAQKELNEMDFTTKSFDPF